METLEQIAELANEFDRRARDHRASVSSKSSIDPNSHLASARRGEARGYSIAADLLRSKFGLSRPTEEKTNG